MPPISATLVKQLRDRTGQPMMDCKKALTESDGHIENAIDLLRKQGMAVMAKRGDRQTTEGRVVGGTSQDGKVAALAMLCSETDFTAKSDEFRAVADSLLSALLAATASPGNIEELGQLNCDDGKTVGDIVNHIVSQTGEKITLGQFARFELDTVGLMLCYIHFNAKLGTLVQIEADTDQTAAGEQVKALASDLAMHITAVNPDAISRDDIDPDAIAREREIASAQVQNKPANIIDKIVDGKMNKWFQQNVLLEQPFVKDDSKTVKQLIDEVAKQLGGQLSLKRFRRLQVG